MPKGEKTGLGRALVKHHNQMIQESKEKGRYYRSQEKKVLESVTEVSDIEAVIEQADEAYHLFSVLNPPVKLPISLPPWNAKMSVEELDDNERRAFLEWRRILARLEENEKLVLTPFEKNLDIWRQLWRVLERSDLLVMVVDARDPLFYRCPDLEAYAREIDEHKKTLLLVNKADLLPPSVRDKWAKYFHQNGILFVFWSAKAATDALEGKKPSQQETTDTDTKIYSRDELLTRLQSEAEEIVSMRKKSKSSNTNPSHIQSDDQNLAKDLPAQSVVVGFVGYPNVGKSSTINALVGGKKTGVTSTPGKTKHFQTLMISEKLTLCDCPGLVFPSFTSSRYEMIASGVLPIDRMTEHREAVQVAANRVPRPVIEDVYRISLPKPKPYEPQNRAPLAAELLRAFCASRGYVASSGLPDETRAARLILKDYIDGKLPHFEMPPGIEDDDEDEEDGNGPGSSDDEVEAPSIAENVMNDLNSFDMDNGLAAAPAKRGLRKKVSTAPHKQHKKPQRKKDRSWRVRGSEGDGMPVVRVFQKPVNSGPLNV
ncbi:hypothetical protein BUALT_Bualt13G0052300 [Buddleja alternifolia]|uniref:CP-type G domain-containing protein n=1 Tax=Buddleja alternifolia TaxID=168488 RepID=A0AAV6WKN0_9LAMI|nr:hypothetical protein BUALT_Bualt13G0052300 [Buddleja alternifolia]